MFERDQFIQACLAALNEDDAKTAVRGLIAETVSNPKGVMRELGEPARGEVQTIYSADKLVILNVLWGPKMAFYPHNHNMWAVIGIYTGQEDNTFYQRSSGGLIRHGGKSVVAKEVVALGESAIHAVTNPLEQITAAIHVYGGDFFGAARSEWDPDTFEERPYDFENTKRAFEESNARLQQQA